MQELVLTQPVSSLGGDAAREIAKSRRHRAFESCLTECGPLAFRVAQGVLRNPADAEDVAQDALLRAYQKFDRLQDLARFRGWLVRITFRLALGGRQLLARERRRHPRERPGFFLGTSCNSSQFLRERFSAMEQPGFHGAHWNAKHVGNFLHRITLNCRKNQNQSHFFR
jgi:DNA-directed RNA polymerase specialized sigma24 family protein